MGFHPDRFPMSAIPRKVGWLAQWQDLGLGTEELAPRQIIIYAITGLCAHRTARALISPPTLNQYRSILGAVG